MIKLLLLNVRFSYVNVWEPKSKSSEETPKYSVSILIPKDDTKTINDINQAIEQIKKEEFKAPAKNLKTPLRDGDVDKPEDPAYAGHYFLNANTVIKPGVLNKYKQPITSQEEFYSGCYGHVTIHLYPFNKEMNKGIACGLGNVMKTEEGEPLGGISSAEEDFASIEIEEDELFS